MYLRNAAWGRPQRHRLVRVCRLWCIFEIAAYAALNSSGRVVLAPVFMGWMQVLLLLCSYYLSVVMWLATIAESLNLSAYLIAISPLCFVTHAPAQEFPFEAASCCGTGEL